MTTLILVAWGVGLAIWFVGSSIRLNRLRPAKPMEQIKPNRSGGANFEARTVRDIIEPTKSIFNKVSVKAALDEMQARAIDSSPVIDQRGELLGTVSKDKMNRKAGGLGHDPKTEPVEAYMEKDNPYCFEDETVAEAEQLMLNANVGEVPVVTREKLLVGTINIEAIVQAKRRKKCLEPLWEIPRLRAAQSSVRYRYSTTNNQRLPQKLKSAVTEGF